MLKRFVTVTEAEISRGIFDSEDVRKRALCFVRTFDDIGGDLDNEKPGTLGRFIDISSDNRIDKEASVMLRRLRARLSSCDVGMRRYEVPWKGVAMEQSSDYDDYLDQFCRDFVSEMKSLINTRNAWNSSERLDKNQKELYCELLHHAHLALLKSKVCFGREATFDRMRNYFLSSADGPRRPLVVYGPSGSGKTAVMARAAVMVHTWMPTTKPVVILRFLGTSPASSDVVSTAKSLVAQTCLAFGKSPPAQLDQLSKLGDVRKEFTEVLRMVESEHPDSALVIMLDSVDQLSPRNGAHEFSWVQRHLPRNVFFVMSVVSDRNDYLERARQRVNCDDSFVLLSPLSDEAVQQFVKTHLATHSRSLTLDQLDVVRSAIARCCNPLFVKLVVDMALKWTSYTPVCFGDLPKNMSSAIMMLFESVEATFGPVFVSHAMGYLTCARGGLTAVEIDDALSCDDEVLNDVYRYHDPPLEGTVRMPSLMWARVSERLREYLTEKQVDAKTVTTWYHRQFWEVAEQRYLADSATVVSYHRRLAELYDQENGIRRTIVLSHRRNKVIVDADRKVRPQPLTEHNLRKLECLPFHLICSGDVEYLKKRCLVSFVWLRTLMRAVGLNAMINEYRTMAEHPLLTRDASIRLVGDLLRICYDSLKCDADLFAYSVVERLAIDGDTDELLQKFVGDAKQFMEQAKQPSMYPTHSMKLPGLDSPLRFTVLVGNEGVLSKDGRAVVCKFSEKNSQTFRINAFNLQTLDLTASIPLTKASPVAITKDGRHFAYLEGTFLKMCETDTGELHREFSFAQQQPDVVFQTIRCLTISENQRYMAAGVKLVSNQAEAKQRGSYSFIGVIDTQAFNETPKSVKLRGKKVVDGLWFVRDDTKLVASFRHRVLVISLPDLVVVNEVSAGYTYYGVDTLVVVPSTAHVLVGTTSQHGCKVLRLDVDTFAQTWSPLLQAERGTECESVPFGLVCMPTDGKVLLGVAGVGRVVRNSQLWTWNPDSEDTDAISLGVKQWKFCTALAVLDACSYAVIGWNNGDICICDLTERLEVLSFHAHGSQINLLRVTHDEENIVSLSDDHNLKLWGVRQLLDSVKKQRIEGQNEGVVPSEQALSLINDPDEQCVGVCVLGEYAASATHINEDGLKFWRLDSGFLEPTMTADFDHQYKESLAKNGISFTMRCHAEVQCFSDYLLYSRKLRRSASCCIIQGFRNPLKIVAHEFFPNTYLTLAVADDRVDSDDAFRVFLVCDGFVDVRDPTLRSQYTIDIPKITEDIPNMDTNAGKRRLLGYKLGITTDWKYLIIVNPTTSGSSVKYLDVVGLTSRSYCCRIVLDQKTSWKILHDGFYYLTRSAEEGSNDYQLLRGDEMAVAQGNYRCLISCDKQLLSNDFELGVLLNEGDNSIEVWQTGSLPARICVFRGHSMMVTSAVFSPDKRLLVSGSLDNTVRLWSLAARHQLCVFHTYGAVEQVAFDETTTYVVVHGTSAPLRKRALVLKVTNVSGTKEIGNAG